MEPRAPTGKKAPWDGRSTTSVIPRSTLIVTFIYAVFFAREIAPDGDTGGVILASVDEQEGVAASGRMSAS